MISTLVNLPGYRISEQLYNGSRTLVYQAVRETDSLSVVIKLLKNPYPNFGELVQFRNQYTIAKNLPIPGIVPPLSLESIGSSYALIMENDGGISLEKYAQQQSLELKEVLAIAIQIADILHNLSQHRVVHKDIKPANILIHPESKQIKLIDFSIASLLPKETPEIQNPNILEGTLAYLAPEQTGRMNRGIDYRADFYALGVSLYQLLTATLPFTSDDPLELVHCHIAKMPVRANQVNPQTPAMVAAIVTKLMAKNAEDRYQSALGLKHDLEQCLTQWKATAEIREFELGQRDLSDRFLIPEKLYGRENEVQQLLESFERVAVGNSEMMLVAGFSGIGKTAVVNEVHKPIVKQRGYFIKGKFDQFNRNIPLFAFVQALRDLMQQLLSESDVQLQTWKTSILQAVGENGQVLIDVIPELEQIIGKQPTVVELSGSAAQNRFNLLFQKFIAVFTTAEHPLVIFLDDLQWADLASLQLIKLLMNDNGYLLMLGAYRDNEVSPAHPLMLTVEELKKAQAIVNTITLTPLAFDDTNQLVVDTLNCAREVAQPLTELITRKTQGNPFFTTQFLKALHDDGYISFDCDRRYWQCDIAQVKALALTDDVVEFMALQLQKLPDETRQILKLAACIGNQFDLNTLAIVSEQSSTDAATALWKALQEGLILPTSQVYKFFQDAEASDTESTVNPTYRFLHDRVQQAAYSLIPAELKEATHLKIGQLLLQNRATAEQNSQIFAIVNQLNRGIGLVTQPSARYEIAHLNLLAGQKAKVSTAYVAALNYLGIGIQLLAFDCWQSQYDLTLAIYQEAVEAAYLSSNFDQMQEWIEVVLHKSLTLLDKIKVYNVKMQACMAQNHLPAAIQIGLQVLQLLGLEFPENPHPSDIQTQLEATLSGLTNKSPLDLIALPEMTDPFKQAAMQILNSLAPCAYQAAPLLLPLIVSQEVSLSMQYGNTALSAPSYGYFGVILCGVVEDIETGYQFGQLALSLLDRVDAKHIQARTIFIVNASVRHWCDPVQKTLEPLQLAYTIGLETGDLEFAALSTYIYVYHAYLCGQELSMLEREIASYNEKLVQLKQKNSLNFNQILHQTILNLIQQTQEPSQLTGNIYEEQTMLIEHQQANDATAIFYVYFNKLILCYLFEQFSEAVENAAIAASYLGGVTGNFVVVPFYFYDSLAQIALFPDALDAQKPSILNKLQVNREKVQKWAHYAPANHQHKLDLMEAERYRISGNKIEAIEYYDRAISLAKANGYIQEQALANELAAKFYLDWGKEKVAGGYMQEAYYCYAHWGAAAKVKDLEHRYPKLLAPILQQRRASLSANETVSASIYLTSATQSSSTSISATLDLGSILKASQTLSAEIQLDKLLATLLHTVLENAGADKGALLMPHEHEWFVEAVATIAQPAQVQSITLCHCSEIPHSLIYTVKHSLQPVVIADAAVHPTLSTDAYVVQQQPKSLLCTPILHQGKLMAILYLENRVTVGAFTSDRVQLLNFLCAQAAISLENARLYQQAQNYAQQLEQSQLQIVQSEKMASLGNLVAGVAHEVNNPIGFLNGSINNAKEYVQDLLTYLELYQQHHPHPASPVQEMAEDIDLEFLSEDLPKLLDSMTGASDRIKSISTSLRTFSRADTDRKVTANLHEGIDSTLLILKYRLKANQHRPAIQVIQNYGDLPLVNCFPGQLNQVFMNILANAIDALEESNSKRSFEDIQANPNRITITTSVENHLVKIAIADNGKGMSESVKQKIFDHLFTTKEVGKGTGLGLAIAKQIIESTHSGKLICNSVLGEGTEFIIEIPL
ncbi:MAG: AAA family ATPase [Desmonostoc vinosum HA7617-LM4]|jgi:predicted ATPase/signal transduction histidine kinase|nr:AAA family ATPase [Desmonostoc vinosum HA7617-LM4]